MRTLHRSTRKPFAWRTALAGTAALALLVAPASLPAAQAKSPTPPVMVQTVAGPQVSIQNFEFSPAMVEVPAGSTVTWTNNDGELHTVTSSENVFTSPGLDADETFSYTFSTPGTYTYYCKLHPHMTGTIVVK
jgi:plastocyanin